MHPIRIIVNGAQGKMGRLAAETLKNHPQFTIVGETDRRHVLADEIKKTKADIVVDFTNAESAFSNISTIIESGAHPVMGTTGLTQEQILTLQKQSRALKRGGIIAPNFSIGAILMMTLAAQAAKFLPNVEIIELHHAGKMDSPSGTALKTAELIAANTLNPPVKSVRETLPHARGALHHDIPIHSIRLPGLMAHEQVLLGGVGEVLTIRHDSIDRQCFMPGVVLACEKVMRLSELIYGLENIIF